MMRRAIFMAVVVGLLISGFLGNALADDRIWPNDPQPTPRQYGDPDWPAFSKVHRFKQFLAGENTGLLSIDPVGPGSRSIERWQTGPLLDERRSLSRRYEVRILGSTTRIWR